MATDPRLQRINRWLSSLGSVYALVAVIYFFVNFASNVGRPVQDDSVAHQLNLVFEYPASPKIDAVTLQIVLSHGPEGPWPPYTYMLIEAFNADGSSPNHPMQPTPQSGAADG